jgi:hypothetical protein
VGFRSMVYFVLSAFYFQVMKREHPLRDGDAFDHRHAVAAGYCDYFVNNDEYARKYATQGCRNGQRAVTLDEFLNLLEFHADTFVPCKRAGHSDHDPAR